MRRLINYICSCFCKHDLELIKTTDMYWEESDTMPIGTKWVYRCKKCGWHKIIKDY